MSVLESRNLSVDTPMIHRGFRRNKMGNIISKKKEKREGLMSQMRDIAENNNSHSVSRSPSVTPSTSTSLPSPPPRNLASTLASPVLSQEFLAFLTTLDEATGLEEHECGRADTFRFVLDVRALEEEKEDNSSFTPCLGRYFNTCGGGLVLDNRMLWEECRVAVSQHPLTAKGRDRLALAAQCCCSELDSLHLLFLSQRKEVSAVCQIISCIL